MSSDDLKKRLAEIQAQLEEMEDDQKFRYLQETAKDGSHPAEAVKKAIDYLAITEGAYASRKNYILSGSYQVVREFLKRQLEVKRSG